MINGINLILIKNHCFYYMANKICIGTGLISLDILIRRGEEQAVSYRVGGTCGNVMMILAYMGWDSYPVARLNGSENSQTMLEEMAIYGVHTNYISTKDDGATPIIVQHNIVDKDGKPTHKFEFRGNKGGFFLDYKPVTKKEAIKVITSLDFEPAVFFFDRVNPATIAMSEYFKKRQILVYFEPSSLRGNWTQIEKCIINSDIVKFANQRLPEVAFTEKYNDKLFIQTLGCDGLQFKLFDRDWEKIPAILNRNIVDTSGAGDWTTATFLDEMLNNNITGIHNLTRTMVKKLLVEAQKKGSESCSYEGARGMMFNKVHENIQKH